MHEISIVRQIFSTLEETYSESHEKIVKVEIEAGLLSNIQPILIQNAFEAICVEEPHLRQVELEVRVLPIVAFCSQCNQDFEVKFHRFVCPCGTPSKKITQGEELQIAKVDFKE